MKPMMSFSTFGSLMKLGLLGCLLLPSVKAQACKAVPAAAAGVFANGYSGHVILNGLKNPRGIIFDSKDNLLIVEQAGGGVRRVTFTDNEGTDICVNSSTQIIKDNTVSFFFPSYILNSISQLLEENIY